MRTGVVAKKIGMTRLFQDKGRHVPVTVLEVQCTVVGQRRQDKDGYIALQIGYGSAKEKHVNKAQQGFFKANNVTPALKIKEFRVSEDALVDIGEQISVDHFIPAQHVDITGISEGKGFAGGMKRHNFAGLRASHGVSVSHRSHGATGNRQDPGRVFKGKKMAGHMGAKKVTTQNLKVVATDIEKGLLYIHGAVPGHKGSLVVVRDAIKKTRPSEAPFPASIKA